MPWYATVKWKCTIAIIIVSGVLGLIVGIAIGSDDIEQSKEPFTLLRQVRVTPGETYKIEINNQSDNRDACTSDLCSMTSCSNVNLTLDSALANISGKLDASGQGEKLDLSRTNYMTATLVNEPIKVSKSYADWVFHLHRGSTLNITLCAEATGSNCQAEEYNFAIIQGKQNFAKWSRDELKPYTVYITDPSLMSVADCQRQSVSKPIPFTYPENADYYHIIRNSGKYGCDMKVFATARLERKQYHDSESTTCVASLPVKPSCVKPTRHAKYVLVKIDTNSETIDWTDREQGGFLLTCDLIINSNELAKKVVPAFAVPALVLIGSVLILVIYASRYMRQRCQYERIEDGPPAAINNDDNNHDDV